MHDSSDSDVRTNSGTRTRTGRSDTMHSVPWRIRLESSGKCLADNCRIPYTKSKHVKVQEPSAETKYAFGGHSGRNIRAFLLPVMSPILECLFKDMGLPAVMEEISCWSSRLSEADLDLNTMMYDLQRRLTTTIRTTLKQVRSGNRAESEISFCFRNFRGFWQSDVPNDLMDDIVRFNQILDARENSRGRNDRSVGQSPPQRLTHQRT